MPFSHRTRGALAQVFDSVNREGIDTLLYKHIGNLPRADMSSLEIARRLDDDVVRPVLTELTADNRSVRLHAPTKHVFDNAVEELRRWLLHDGWTIENGELVRLAPAAEEVTGMRDRLLEEIELSGLDRDDGIKQALERSSDSFASDPPDYNGAITNVRIALETLARRAAEATGEAVDSWGRSLHVLRNVEVIDPDEEQVLARVYTFTSDGAHRPRGIGDQEWATLARTFGIGSVYFLLHKLLSTRPHQ